MPKQNREDRAVTPDTGISVKKSSTGETPWFRRPWVAAVLAVALLTAGATLWRLRAPHPNIHAAVTHVDQSAAPDEDQDAVPVTVVRPSPGGITRTSAQVGSVYAYEEADLYAKVSGYLTTLKVDIGDRVKEGEELAKIDDPELVKDRDHAAAVLAQSQAAVAQAEAAIVAYQAAAKKAQAEVARYTSTRRFREKALARYQGLLAKQAVPPSVVDEEMEHLESAHAAESAAQAEVLAANAKVEQAKADKIGAEATVAVSRAALEKSQELVKYLTIRSPYTGVVTARFVHPGDFIRSAADGNQKPLLHVARNDLMRVVTFVPDRDVPYVDIGDTAEITLDAISGVIQGKVWRFAESEDPESRTMRTEILVNNKDGKVRQGMFGETRIVLEKMNAALSIPASAIVGESKNGKASVYVVRDGEAKLTDVKVGADDGIRAEIVKGLAPDDQVVANVSAVNDGTPVVVQDKSDAKPSAANVGH